MTVIVTPIPWDPLEPIAGRCVHADCEPASEETWIKSGVLRKFDDARASASGSRSYAERRGLPNAVDYKGKARGECAVCSKPLDGAIRVVPII